MLLSIELLSKGEVLQLSGRTVTNFRANCYQCRANRDYAGEGEVWKGQSVIIPFSQICHFHYPTKTNKNPQWNVAELLSGDQLQYYLKRSIIAKKRE